MIKPHDPLTHRFPRSLAEAANDPRAWWTTGKAAAAEEEFLRAQFDGNPPPHRSPLRMAISAAVLVVFVSLAAQLVLVLLASLAGGVQ